MGSSDPLVAETRELAHDLRNLLNPLGLQVELLRRRVGGDERAVAVLDGMSEVLERAEEALQRLRDLADKIGSR